MTGLWRDFGGTKTAGFPPLLSDSFFVKNLENKSGGIEPEGTNFPPPSGRRVFIRFLFQSGGRHFFYNSNSFDKDFLYSVFISIKETKVRVRSFYQGN